MKWWEAGEGDPVVYVHGIPTSPALWRYVIEELPEMRNLAWEMVGYGDSIPEGKNRDISVAMQADYLVQWMDALEIESATLVGHDLGGGVAQIAAVRHPDRVRGLVLTNSICYDSWPIPSVKAIRSIAPVFAKLPNAVLYLVIFVLMSRGHDDSDKAQEAIATHWARYRDLNGTAALARQVSALDVQDTLVIADELSSLDLPARLVWGEADPFQTIDYGERLAVDLGAPLDAIEGGKHFVPEDHPDRIADAVRKVVKET